MLTYSEIAQLSDRDLGDEITRTRDSLFRQKMGVRTNHLKDSHLIKILKKYLAQLLTESTRRMKFGEKVEKTSAEVEKKAKDFSAEVEKKQTAKKVVKASKVKKEDQEAEDEKIKAKSSADVKVKKVEKKGFFSRKKKTEKES
ncbi:MAG: 50S ribosomal protein L29 [Candidatus Peribacteraceae bacterium]|nr:50S ribosomal protein L29 [Candidatus Peribacteraceae bacterium]